MKSKNMGRVRGMFLNPSMSLVYQPLPLVLSSFYTFYNNVGESGVQDLELKQKEDTRRSVSVVTVPRLYSRFRTVG